MELWLETDSAGDAYKILPDGASSPDTDGYALSNDLAEWEKRGLMHLRGGGSINLRDYKVLRAKIGSLVAGEIAVATPTATFGNIAQTSKDMASRWFVVVKADRDSVPHTDAQQTAFGKVFHAKSVVARTARVVEAVSLIFTHLLGDDADTVINDTESLVELYIKYGREGTLEGDNEYLFDYIEGRTTTVYAVGGSLPGLAHKGFVMQGDLTLAQLITAIMDILSNGVY